MSASRYRLSLALFMIAACNSGTGDQTGAVTDSDGSTSGGTTTGQTTQTSQATEPTTTTTTPTSTTDASTTGDPLTGTSSTTTTGETSTTDDTSSTSETGTTTGGPTCDDGEKNADETDTDCGGGTCAPCADGSACVMDSDCEIMSCVQSTCGLPPPGCDDGEKNADETDIDCGGPVCDTCDDNLACVAPEDCKSKNCVADLCVPAACDDTILNGSESDIDCGGADCDKCGEGGACGVDGDCDTNSCVDGLCVPATCDDGKVNQDETDVDCGGATCDKCGDGLDCELAADCTSGVCDPQAKSCSAASCTDTVQNGMETDVDCGGPDCKPCSIPGLVINEVDYDQVGTDSAEFVEILNNTAAPIDLANHALVLVNGSNNLVYTTVSLAAAGTLDPGQYLIVANANFAVPPEAKKVNFAKANDNVENGSPDGLAIVDTAAMKVIDAFSYEGSITMVMIANVGMVSLVEGTVLPANVQDSNTEPASLVRLPNGYDGNNAATDWKKSKTPTPAAANVP